MPGLLLKGKTVLLGVTGSIAAYKAAAICSRLIKLGAEVHVVMTKNATKFIAPLTFSTYTGNKTCVDTFDENFEYKVGHVSIAKKADLAIVAPATANIIAKMAHGIADDMLTTTLLATTAPIIISPAMNTKMFLNPATQENLDTLKRRGIRVIEPDSGLLACGDEGPGKMPEPEVIVDYVCKALTGADCSNTDSGFKAAEIARGDDESQKAPSIILEGKKVLISAGPTREPIDPVRFISNHSTGKMGYALARAAVSMGAEVTLVSGPVSLETPCGVQRVDILSAADMEREISSRAVDSDIIIMSAAVADFTPANPASEKIKKKESNGSVLELKSTVDILAGLGKNKKPGQFICGFSMETQNVIENSSKKLAAKNADMIVANDLRKEGAGFGTDTNIVTLIKKDGHRELPIMSKDEVAYAILEEIAGA